MKQLYEENCACIALIETVIDLYRRQNYYAAAVKEQEILRTFSVMMERLIQLNDPNYKVLQDLMVLLLEAKEQDDNVLLADLYQAQMLPFLFSLQEQFQEDEYANYWQRNLESLQDDELLRVLKADTNQKSKCFIEKTSVGAKTIRIENNNRSWYLHSNINPWKEADFFAEEYYELQYTNYLIWGLGLGYHVEKIRQKNRFNRIVVFESNLEVLQSTFLCSDLTDMLKSGQVKIVYDPEVKKIAEYLTDFEGVFAIHAPSLKCIEQKDAKERLEEYFLHLSSIKNQLGQLIQNFNQNIGSIHKVVDEIHEKWENKEIILVAGGPSLEKNLQTIQRLKENRILLAVGTVAKKLLTEGIVPDYIIMTDSSPVLTRQVDDVDWKGIPLLYMSTVAPEVLSMHNDEQYCILQKGFSPAERYAEEHKIRTYETGGSVSTTAIELAIRFAATTVYCFGLDLAYTDSKTHAEGTAAYQQVDVSNLRQVKSVEGKLVPTVKNLDSYRHWIERRIKDETKIQFINVSRGAYIHGMKNVINIGEL